MTPSPVTKSPNAPVGYAGLSAAKSAMAEADSQQTGSTRSPKSAPVAPGGTRAAGGGTLRSSKEIFGVDPNTGTLTLSLPIRTAAGRAGSDVALSIAYDSAGGNGELGVGWNMATDSISRKTSKQLPTYTDRDTFVWGSKDLIPKNGGKKTLQAEWHQSNNTGRLYHVQEYFTAVLEQNDRVEHWVCTTEPNDSWWKVTSPSNSVAVYGFTDSSRVSSSAAHVGNEDNVFSWLLCYSYDSGGNSIKHTYKSEDAKGLGGIPESLQLCEENRDPGCRYRARYLKSVAYSNKSPSRDMSSWAPLSPEDPQDWLFEVILDYGEHDEDQPSTLESQDWSVRADPFSTCTSGFEIRYYRLCRRILMFHHFPDELETQDYLTASTVFTYDETATASYLTRMATYSHARDESGAFLKKSLTPCTFTYTSAPRIEELSLKKLKMANLESLPGGTHLKCQWIDLAGCGSPGLLLERSDGTMAYQDNESSFDGDAQLAQSAVLRSQLGHSPHERFFEDLDRNGDLELVVTDAEGFPTGFYPYSDSRWHSMQSFKSVPSVNFNDPGVKRVDLTGDGLKDVFLLDGKQSGFAWHESMSIRGFSQSKPVRFGQQVPGILIAKDSKSCMQFADMTGDGLADLVRISNGQVVYWPNLGYGRFGKEVRMHNSPWMSSQEDFDGSRVTLADLDGYGPTDLMYFPRSGGVVMYTNQSGNSWKLRGKLTNFPSLDSVSNVSIVDLFGNGTSCLCWTGANYAGGGDSVLRYIDLFKGQKPHLLSTFENGAGRRTTITYRPSTFYFQEDKGLGKPWKTKLPFPVQCVHEVRDEDMLRETMTSTRYAYHDGDYDIQDNRFCGFRMVETWDAETFTTTKHPGHSPTEGALRRPPVHKKVWYHTNTFIENADLSQAYDWGSLAPSPVALLGDGAIDEKSRQIACQALRGKPLLEETYSDDGSPLECVPYSASWSSYDVLMKQPAFRAHRPVFRVNSRESMSIHSERQLVDQRISRQCVLSYNDWGQPTRSVSIAYGRSSTEARRSPLPMRIDVRQAQEETVVEVSDVAYTNAITDDDYNFMLPQASSTASYRLQNLELSADLPFDGLKGHVESALQEFPMVDPTEADRSPSVACCLLLGKGRTYFRNSKFTETLELGQMEVYSTVDARYELICPDSVKAPPFEVPGDICSRLDAGGLSFTANDLGYKKLDAAGNELWKPSGRMLHAQPLANQLEAARLSFYQPTVSLDVFDNATVTIMDKYCLASRQVTDPLGNASRVTTDYRTLKPSLTEDFNGNMVENSFGLLDSEVSTAVMGKPGEPVGDTVQGLSATLSQEQIDAFITDPVQTAPFLLKGASSRVIADMTRFFREGSLNFIATIARTRHFREDPSGSSPITVVIDYLDGHLETLCTATLTHVGHKSQPAQWRIEGLNLRDNKGEVFRTYRPYLSDSHLIRMDAAVAKWDTTRFLDPLGREVATLHSDHSWSKTVFSPWSTATYDQSDTVDTEDCALDEHVGFYFSRLPRQDYFPSWYKTQQIQPDLSSTQWSRAAQSLQGCLSLANTPTVVQLDSSGRPISTTVDFGSQNATSSCSYSVSGAKIKDFDALGREVQRVSPDLLCRSVLVSSMDSGQVHIVYNALDQEILSWNSKGVYTRSRFDALGRNTETWVADANSPFHLATRFTYGEAVGDATLNNLRGRVSRIEDQSGLHMFPHYDFKGACPETIRKLCKEYKSFVDWKSPVELEEEAFVTKNWTDAQGHTIRSINARGDEEVSTYDLTGQLQTVKWKSANKEDWTNFQTAAEYDADGNRIRTMLGNGVEEIVLRDPDTNHIIRKTTIQPGGNRVRDKLYTLDSSGRTVYVADIGQDVDFFRNAQVQPDAAYTYDGMGRLILATGREQINDSTGIGRSLRDSNITSGLQALARSTFESVCAYRETYKYDLANRMLALTHEPIGDAKAKAWCRKYFYEERNHLHPAASEGRVSPVESSNRVSRTEVGDVTELYKYEGPDGVAGCVTSAPGLPLLSWNHQNQLRASSTQLCNTGVPEMTYYIYDHAGTRVRKVTERSSSASSQKGGLRMRDNICIGGIRCVRSFAGDGRTLTREKLSSYVHGDERIATVENADIAKFPVEDLIRYEFDGLFELDDEGSLISWNEYAPFGARTYSACRSDVEAPSIYRYCRYEQDSETGLYCVGARNYASWLCRWLSPDPIGIQDSMERYAYSDNDPVNLEDPDGTSTSPRRDKTPEKRVNRWLTRANDSPPPSTTSSQDLNDRASNQGPEIEAIMNNHRSRSPASPPNVLANFKIQKPVRQPLPQVKSKSPVPWRPAGKSPAGKYESIGARHPNRRYVPSKEANRPQNLALHPRGDDNKSPFGGRPPLGAGNVKVNMGQKLDPLAKKASDGPRDRGRMPDQDDRTDRQVLQNVRARYFAVEAETTETLRGRNRLITAQGRENVPDHWHATAEDQRQAFETNLQNLNQNSLESWNMMLASEDEALGSFLLTYPCDFWKDRKEYDAAQMNWENVHDLSSMVSQQLKKRDL